MEIGAARLGKVTYNTLLYYDSRDKQTQLI